jgi:dTDP-4-dehydrorhamnose 3,5-epimerase
MKFQETRLSGAFVLEATKFEDERGYFIEAWKQDLAAQHGILENFTGTNISFNKQPGTLRGMHAQQEPHAQAKLVRCMQGAILDVIVDIRPDSLTYLKWVAVELTAENLHGFQTLSSDTTVMYQVSASYHPESEIGARFDDPAFSITWPNMATPILSEKDQHWPAFASRLTRV